MAKRNVASESRLSFCPPIYLLPVHPTGHLAVQPSTSLKREHRPAELCCGTAPLHLLGLRCKAVVELLVLKSARIQLSSTLPGAATVCSPLKRCTVHPSRFSLLLQSEGFSLRELSSTTCREDLEDPERMLSASPLMPPGDDCRAGRYPGIPLAFCFHVKVNKKSSLINEPVFPP